MQNSLKVYKSEKQEIHYYHFLYVGKYFKYLREQPIKTKFQSNSNIYFSEEQNSDFFDGERFDSHFIRKTMDQMNFSEIRLQGSKFVMVIIHQFSDSIRRDLDNGSYKPIIDAIKKSRIIDDDSHFHLSLMLFGQVGEQEEINVFLIPQCNIDEIHNIIYRFI